MPISVDVPDLTNVPPDVTTDHQIAWLPIWEDKDGNPIVNTAHQLPIKPYYDAFSVFVYNITVYKQEYSGSNVRDEHNTLNSGAWQGWQPGECWCMVRYEEITDGNGVDGFEVTYTVRCLRDYGWKFRHPEVGYVYIDGSDLQGFHSEDNYAYIGKLDSSGGQAGLTDTLIITKANTKREVSFSFTGLS